MPQISAAVSKPQFLPPQEHFELMVDDLDDLDFDLYQRLGSIRAETAYEGRNFIVYRMNEQTPEIIDTLTVLDFKCDNLAGASTEIRSHKLNETIIVGYEPMRLFNYPVFMWIPLHTKVSWGASRMPGARSMSKGSLGFGVTLKTEAPDPDLMCDPNIVHCHTGYAYHKKFGNQSS